MPGLNFMFLFLRVAHPATGLMQRKNCSLGNDILVGDIMRSVSLLRFNESQAGLVLSAEGSHCHFENFPASSGAFF